jgi:hypothetical protein
MTNITNTFSVPRPLASMIASVHQGNPILQAAAHGVTIKNLKFSEFASQETSCFKASVYINGVRKGEVSNEGHGGANSYVPWSLHNELEAIAKELPPCDMSMCGIKRPLPQSADLIISDLVEAELTRREIARKTSTSTWFRKPGMEYKPGEWTVIKTATSSETIAFVQQKYGADALILSHNHHTLD